MDAEFWHARWRDNEIGFHQAEVNPWLRRFWPELGVADGARVLVPLCGKSSDLLWLRDQGCQVVGIELSPLAVEQFFLGAGIKARVEQAGPMTVWRGAGVEIFCGDFFALTPALLGQVEGFYDRAALIALPPPMRRDYVGQLTRLVGDASGLLLTLEYDQQRVDGPPFSVPTEEVRDLYQPRFAVTERHQHLNDDLPPRFRDAGLSVLGERVYRIGPG